MTLRISCSGGVCPFDYISMATKLLYPTCYMVPQVPQINIKSTVASHWSVLAIHPWTKNTKAVAFHTTRVAEQSPGLVVDDEEVNQTPTLIRTIDQIKEDLYQAVQGLNRGIFGVPSAKKSQIHGLVEMLESQNPTPDPTLNLQKVGGCWKLVYSTITILGSKRTKLGLRDFISLGDFFQNIDVVQGKAVNVIKFNVRGLNLLNGQLMIEASFKIASKSRVDINYEKSTITPDQLMNVFRKNYHVLLGIFNPDGWLEITYVDGTLRIGRDDSGNIFILQRSDEAKT